MHTIINMNCLWRSCLLMDRDEMSNLYKGPSIDASYEVSIHLDQQFQRRRFFKNRPIRNKNCLWWPCLLMDRDEMSNHYRGSSINASYQVSIHLAEWFQRRRLKCEKLTDDRRRQAKWNMKNTIANIRILDVVRLVHGYNEQKMLQKICNRPSEIHCLNSDGTGDLSLLRYKPDFVVSLFVINELYCIK